VPIMNMLMGLPPAPENTTTTTTTTSTTPGPHSGFDTDLGLHGCQIEGRHYPDGARVPSGTTDPCDLCYCIRNQEACVKQECVLSVDGCEPVYVPGVCCPVSYNCGKSHTLNAFLLIRICLTLPAGTLTFACWPYLKIVICSVLWLLIKYIALYLTNSSLSIIWIVLWWVPLIQSKI
jgi:hypothetical protein